jgi:hypothetical protein
LHAMDLHGTILWVYASTIATYLVLAAVGAWFMWRSTLSHAFVVRSVDGSWSKEVSSIRRAERTALMAADRAPLEIVDSNGKVIGRLGFGLATGRRVAGGR